MLLFLIDHLCYSYRVALDRLHYTQSIYCPSKYLYIAQDWYYRHERARPNCLRNVMERGTDLCALMPLTHLQNLYLGEKAPAFNATSTYFPIAQSARIVSRSRIFTKLLWFLVLTLMTITSPRNPGPLLLSLSRGNESLMLRRQCRLKKNT
jgi:hypothetical protein